ncbi:hypothetical protein AGR8A_Cc40626 [Agrobacterium fabrum str. J-07]|nr:hypothetical protein AGR8A_Cc40626 [Agrobacterium fabrum str. J-07]
MRHAPEAHHPVTPNIYPPVESLLGESAPGKRSFPLSSLYAFQVQL